MMNIWVPVLSVSGASLIPLIISFIKAYYDKRLVSSKSRFYLGLVFFISILMTIVELALRYGLYCKHIQAAKIIDQLPVNFYVCQATFLMIILFTRLISIFKGTDLAISYCTIAIFASLAFIYPALTASGYLVSSFSSIPSIGGFMILVAMLVFISQVAWLNGLFIYKLYKLQKTDKIDKDKYIQAIMVKTTILCLIGTSASILTMFAWVVVGVVGPNGYTQTLIVFAAIIDLYTNFFSILLSYNYYDKWYERSCCCCTSLFKYCCGGRDEFKEDIKMMGKEVEINVSVGTTS